MDVDTSSAVDKCRWPSGKPRSNRQGILINYSLIAIFSHFVVQACMLGHGQEGPLNWTAATEHEKRHCILSYCSPSVPSKRITIQMSIEETSSVLIQPDNIIERKCRINQIWRNYCIRGSLQLETEFPIFAMYSVVWTPTGNKTVPLSSGFLIHFHGRPLVPRPEA